MLAWVGELIAVHTGSGCEEGWLPALLTAPWCQHLPCVYSRPREQSVAKAKGGNKETLPQKKPNKQTNKCKGRQFHVACLSLSVCLLALSRPLSLLALMKQAATLGNPVRYHVS